MSVAENILFGVSSDPTYQSDSLINNEEIRSVLSEVGVLEDLLKAGHKIAQTMVELFSGVDPDSELFEQFSFISAEDLPGFSGLLAVIESDGLDALPEDDRHKLISLSFKLSSARHRLGIIDDHMQSRLLEARKAIVKHWENGESPIEFFDRDHYHPAISIQDNILFGRLMHGQARAHSKVGEVITQTITELGLKDSIIRAGLDYQVGVGGSRLTNAQRQRLAIARCLIKSSDLLIVNQAASVLDATDELALLNKIVASMKGKGLIWVTDRADLAQHFDEVLLMADGKLKAKGKFDEIKDNREFAELTAPA